MEFRERRANEHPGLKNHNRFSFWGKLKSVAKVNKKSHPLNDPVVINTPSNNSFRNSFIDTRHGSPNPLLSDHKRVSVSPSGPHVAQGRISPLRKDFRPVVAPNEQLYRHKRHHFFNQDIVRQRDENFNYIQHEANVNNLRSSLAAPHYCTNQSSPTQLRSSKRPQSAIFYSRGPSITYEKSESDITSQDQIFLGTEAPIHGSSDVSYRNNHPDVKASNGQPLENGLTINLSLFGLELQRKYSDLGSNEKNKTSEHFQKLYVSEELSDCTLDVSQCGFRKNLHRILLIRSPVMKNQMLSSREKEKNYMKDKNLIIHLSSRSSLVNKFLTKESIMIVTRWIYGFDVFEQMNSSKPSHIIIEHEFENIQYNQINSGQVNAKNIFEVFITACALGLQELILGCLSTIEKLISHLCDKLINGIAEKESDQFSNFRRKVYQLIMDSVDLVDNYSDEVPEYLTVRLCGVIDSLLNIHLYQSYRKESILAECINLDDLSLMLELPEFWVQRVLVSDNFWCPFEFNRYMVAKNIYLLRSQKNLASVQTDSIMLTDEFGFEKTSKSLEAVFREGILYSSMNVKQLEEVSMDNIVAENIVTKAFWNKSENLRKITSLRENDSSALINEERQFSLSRAFSGIFLTEKSTRNRAINGKTIDPFRTSLIIDSIDVNSVSGRFWSKKFTYAGSLWAIYVEKSYFDHDSCLGTEYTEQKSSETDEHKKLRWAVFLTRLDQNEESRFSEDVPDPEILDARNCVKAKFKLISSLSAQGNFIVDSDGEFQKGSRSGSVISDDRLIQFIEKHGKCLICVTLQLM